MSLWFGSSRAFFLLAPGPRAIWHVLARMSAIGQKRTSLRYSSTSSARSPPRAVASNRRTGKHPVTRCQHVLRVELRLRGLDNRPGRSAEQIPPETEWIREQRNDQLSAVKQV